MEPLAVPRKLSWEASQAIPSDWASAGTLDQRAVRSAHGAKGPGLSWDISQEQDALDESLLSRACLGAPPLRPRVLGQDLPL